MQLLDWTLLRSFHAVAQTGSLSAAAAYLMTTQPTLSRHIRELELQLGIALFARSARGLEPTQMAQELIEDAQAMGDAAQAFALKARARSEKLTGIVRITAITSMANLILPSVLFGLRSAEPNIQIDLIPSDQPLNLARREADIAIQIEEPEQNALVARKLGESMLGLYGAKSYFSRRGRLGSKDDLVRHDVIGLNYNDIIPQFFQTNGLAMRQDHFPIRTNSHAANWSLLLAGLGLALVQAAHADRHPELERVDLGLRFPAVPIWLVMHEEVRSNRRIRRVADFLADHVPAALGHIRL